MGHNGHAFLHSARTLPDNPFTGLIRSDDVHAVGGEAFLRSLAGNPVTISGRIELYKNRPEIVISSRGQIEKETVSPKGTGTENSLVKLANATDYAFENWKTLTVDNPDFVKAVAVMLSSI